ncbi:SAGA-associated factor 29-like, partial [Polyodon spathula]|uniref:SAGA-associated factor 29-like n=1 Tax=Polyodon spathula TaxID=7913 RepID=UPI001B7DE445
HTSSSIPPSFNKSEHTSPSPPSFKKISPYYRTKLRGLYTTAKADAEAECGILRRALDKIAEIKSLLEERRIMVSVKMSGLYSDADPPRKTMRRGVLMTLLQQSAMTLPLWIGKPGDT